MLNRRTFLAAAVGATVMPRERLLRLPNGRFAILSQLQESMRIVFPHAMTDVAITVHHEGILLAEARQRFGPIHFWKKRSTVTNERGRISASLR